jgi:hypothetical protein
MVTNFIARAVVDEVIMPSFLADELIMGLGGDVVEQAKVLFPCLETGFLASSKAFVLSCLPWL